MNCVRKGWGARLALCFIVALLVMAAPLAHAAQGRKVALIIGNSHYANTTSLTNPSNDTRLIAQSAREAGFDVTLVSDQTNNDFQRTLREFRLVADGAEIAMIYYAGHAIEGQGRNWLIPTDAKLETEYDLPYEAINLDRLLESVSGSQVRMLILDSCRNNPFGNSWRRGVRAVPNGLASVEIDDVLIIYAAAPGQVALDGAGGNSPFAKSLAHRLVEPGLPLQLLGGAIRDDVLASTGGRQRPFVSASMTGQPVYLVQKVTVPAAGTDRTALEALAWQGASTSDSLPGYRTFLAQFPNGIFARMANDAIARLESQAAAGNSGGARLSRTPVTNEQPAAQPITNPTRPTGQQGLAASRPDPVPVALKRVDPDVATGDNSLPATSDPQAPSIPASEGLALPTSPATAPAGSPPGTGSMALAQLNEARANAQLPTMPAAPRFSSSAYPACRSEFQGKGDTIAKVDAINACTVALDRFYASTMIGFRQQMSAHQDEISRLYTDKVGGNPVYTPEDQRKFFQAMRKEHADSNPDGPYFADYRTTETRYNEDRKFLQAQYCEYAGCDANGRPLLDASKIRK